VTLAEDDSARYLVRHVAVFGKRRKRNTWLSKRTGYSVIFIGVFFVTFSSFFF